MATDVRARAEQKQPADKKEKPFKSYKLT